MLITNKFKSNSLQILKKNFQNNQILYIGDFISIGLKIYENEKIRFQAYSGLIIAKKNVYFNTTITISCTIQTQIIEYCFFTNSLDLLFIKVLYSINLHRSKLYYLRNNSHRKLNFFNNI